MSHDNWLDETGIGWKRFRVSRGSKKAALRSLQQIELSLFLLGLARTRTTVDAASLRERGLHEYDYSLSH